MIYWIYKQYGPRCAQEDCTQPADGTCARCGARLCYDCLCAHKRRKHDHGPKWPQEPGLKVTADDGR